MARIAGINIPTGKRTVIALTYIHGIGRTTAIKICAACGIADERRVNELSEDEITRIRDMVDQDYTVEGELRRDVAMNINSDKFSVSDRKNSKLKNFKSSKMSLTVSNQ